MTALRRIALYALLLSPLLLLFCCTLAWLLMRQGGLEPFRVPQGLTREPGSDPLQRERGRYLATIGNCEGCHTRQGGAPYAGGRAFATPYGTVYSSNLTADERYGIGAWSLQEFRHTLRHGVSRNGVQSPVFPYANFARLDDADTAALFAYLAQVAPVAEAPPAHAWEFPANLPGSMLAWRLLYYRPQPPAPAPQQTPAWRRGRELVEGIGHCAVCHGARAAFSSQAADGMLGGARVPGGYAPALNAQTLAHYASGDLAGYLRGAAPQARAAYGRMADVIARNLQHLSGDDALAMETFLRTLPAAPERDLRPAIVAADQLARGDRLYREHCADCHGADGGGEAGKYPPLRDASALTGPDPLNAINLILYGAAGPVTALNPQPYTMPPFAQKLTAEDVAALVNTLRQRWGRPPRAVSAGDVDAWAGIQRH